MIQNLLYDQWIFDTRDNFNCPATTAADRNINIKHALKSLRPGHFLMPIHWQIYALLAPRILRIVALPYGPTFGASPCRCYVYSVLTIRGQDSMIAR